MKAARPRGHRRSRFLAALLVAVGMLLAGCTSGEPAVVQGGTFTFVSPGGKLEFSYPAAERQTIGELAGPVVSGESERISTKDHLGEVVVLNVWSTTCGPCRLEAVDLREAAATFSDQPVQFIGINVRDNRDAAADFEVSKGITYPSIEDPTMRTLLSIGGLPTGSIPLTLVLDKQGRVAQIWLRPVQRTELEATVRAVAAEI